MPTSPLSLCVVTGCPNMVAYGRCAEHQTEQRRESDRGRPNGYRRGYSREWAEFSRAYLERHPTCQCDACLVLPHHLRPEATDVDHTGGHSRTCPHRYDERHLKALSHSHHARKTAAEDGSFGRNAATPRCV